MFDFFHRNKISNYENQRRRGDGDTHSPAGAETVTGSLSAAARYTDPDTQ